MDALQKLMEMMEKDALSLLPRSRPLCLGKGATLFEKGQSPDGIFWIRSGNVALKSLCRGARKPERKRKGDVLGVEEVMKGEPFPCKALALSRCEVCFIPRGEFVGWLEGYAHLI